MFDKIFKTYKSVVLNSVTRVINDRVLDRLLFRLQLLPLQAFLLLKALLELSQVFFREHQGALDVERELICCLNLDLDHGKHLEHQVSIFIERPAELGVAPKIFVRLGFHLLDRARACGGLLGTGE